MTRTIDYKPEFLKATSGDETRFNIQTSKPVKRVQMIALLFLAMEAMLLEDWVDREETGRSVYTSNEDFDLMSGRVMDDHIKIFKNNTQVRINDLAKHCDYVNWHDHHKQEVGGMFEELSAAQKTYSGTVKERLNIEGLCSAIYSFAETNGV